MAIKFFFSKGNKTLATIQRNSLAENCFIPYKPKMMYKRSKRIRVDFSYGDADEVLPALLLPFTPLWLEIHSFRWEYEDLIVHLPMTAMTTVIV